MVEMYGAIPSTNTGAVQGRSGAHIRRRGRTRTNLSSVCLATSRGYSDHKFCWFISFKILEMTCSENLETMEIVYLDEFLEKLEQIAIERSASKPWSYSVMHQQHQYISSISASAHKQHQCISSISTFAALMHQQQQHISSNSASAASALQ